MPELAEVERFRRAWNPGLRQTIESAALHPRARVFRGADPDLIQRLLPGRRLLSSQAHGKQLLFRFSRRAWLGVHLGMSGELAVLPAGAQPGAHAHLALFQRSRILVFSDPRQFGRIRIDVGDRPPPWWTLLPPPLLSPSFSTADVRSFLRRRARAPIKAVLLMQERFPGVGNWMADEILWRAGIHPATPAGALGAAQTRRLFHQILFVCREALRLIADEGKDPPPSWLFPHRWEEGGRCPKTGVLLVRQTIGGRTTCWSPGRQSPPQD